MVPDEGEVEIAKRALYANAGSENLTLKLYTALSPALSESTIAADFTEATFTGYSAKTLTSSQSGATWAVPTTSEGITSSTYGTNQSWTASSSQTVLGYYIVGATSNKVYYAEAFAAGKALSSGDIITITVKITWD